MNYPYQLLGTSIPELLARRRLTAQLERNLLKPSPDHIQVVGPTLFGKSVLLHGLAARLEVADNHFVSAAYVDLRHAPPTDDATFRRRFAEVVKKTLARVKPDIAEYIDLDDNEIHELLDWTFQELERQNERLLVVLDGFDHVLAGTGITRNLWDQLRSLAQKSSLQLVTGSRQRLRELCKTEESRTSDFWEVFNPNPVFVGPFTEDDWGDLLGPITASGIAVDGSAQNELMNWSGGVPVLAVAILSRMVSGAPQQETFSKADVDIVAESILDDEPEYLRQLWDDCSYELRGDIALLASEDIRESTLSHERRRQLLDRGYGRSTNKNIRDTCRLMSQHAKRQAPSVSDVRRLFFEAEDYSGNISALLELRVAKIKQSGADGDLISFLSHAVKALQANPATSLLTIRSLVQHALTLIFESELGTEREIPQQWIDQWTSKMSPTPRWFESLPAVPSGEWQRLRLLDLMTGMKSGHEFIVPTSRVLQRPTYLLLNSLQSIGGFGQHLGDYPRVNITQEFAVAVVTVAIEAVGMLTQDLN